MLCLSWCQERSTFFCCASILSDVRNLVKCEEKPTVNPYKYTGDGWVEKVFENNRDVWGGYPFHLLRTSDCAFLFHDNETFAPCSALLLIQGQCRTRGERSHYDRSLSSVIGRARDGMLVAG